ncbi:MAG: BtpA/SgcQ family protein [Candidatus Marinimicrobia bacterium]|nr:BtpA/SgcQ family protein [Candidatus Neomarinimicrobiota bacterium]MCF7850223.1 BtpA/SgcQ family protein [Candidatus Neomarinimicrobiota bacterium]MCF7903735.1 BtpA/SgcQ family protein [Candidatus Neomarinimicrobiota bacterium]
MITDPFKKIFTVPKPIVGMIHVQALPGTPKSKASVSQIADQACREAETLVAGGVQAIMLENMHDVPYLKRQVGPEIVSALTKVAVEVRATTDCPLGIQVLAGANKEALSVAQAADLQFIRSEGFVFGHLADEGFMDSDAAELLRFRKQIGADHIQIFTDVKKKHSSHAITSDLSLSETIHAAEFFLSDGVIVTGSRTGDAVILNELQSAYEDAGLPVFVGSGVTPEGLQAIFPYADAFIVGSYFKKNGDWRQAPDLERLRVLSQTREDLLK